MKLLPKQIEWLSQEGPVRRIYAGRGAGKTVALLEDWRSFSKDFPQEIGLYCSPHKLYEPPPKGLRVFQLSTLSDCFRLSGLAAPRLYIDDSDEFSEPSVVSYLMGLCRSPRIPPVCYIARSKEPEKWSPPEKSPSAPSPVV